MASVNDQKLLLPHHEQQTLCTTRLPYRQGRKLTAVKVYSITNESKHLLVFNVPSLNLRQETKTLFSRFGKLRQFYVTEKHKCEQFTETYHIAFESIHHARLAKRMLDNKCFYGSSLHVCYAPEYDTIEDTKEKLTVRKQDVMYRLRKLEQEKLKNSTEPIEQVSEMPVLNPVKLNMGESNTIGVGKQTKKSNIKRKSENCNVVIEKKFKPCFIEPQSKETSMGTETEVIDCTSALERTITNIEIEKTLNYNKFGSEIIRKVPQKPMNKIIFLNKNT